METKIVKKPIKVEEATCNICFDDFELHKMYEAGCNHIFCENCYKDFQCNKIEEGPGCVNMNCPMKSCPYYVVDSMVTKIQGVDDKYWVKYQQHLLDDFVKWSPNIIFCPEPDCKTVIEIDEKMLSAKGKLPQRDIECYCESQICLRCGEPGHEPVSCDDFKGWVDNLDSKVDKLSKTWISQNTKPCPKCKVDTDKNTGCMRMVCKQCQFQYCWMCKGEWVVAHANPTTAGYWQCNIYKEDPKDKVTKSINERNMKKVQFYLERYADTKNTYKANKSSIIKTKSIIDKISKSMCNESESMTQGQNITLSIDFDFYFKALKLVAKARDFMANTYILANNIVNEYLIDLFAENQNMLLQSLEALNQYLVDHPIKELFQVVNSVCNLCAEFHQHKKAILELTSTQSLQFNNAKTDYQKKDFLENIKIEKYKETDDFKKPDTSITKLDEIKRYWV